MAGPVNYRNLLKVIITFIGGLYFFIEFILPSRALEAIGVGPYHEQISYGFITVGAMAFGLGLINLFLIHGSRVVFQKKGWINSAALLAGLLLMMFLSTYSWIAGLRGSAAADEVKLLSRFADQIKKDQEEGRKDVPSLDFRLEKLKSAVDAVLIKDRERLAAEKNDAPEKVKSAATDASALLEKVNIRISFDGLEAASASLAAFSVALGRFEKAKVDATVSAHLFDLLRNGLFVSLGSAMFSLLAFYIAAAAYRAFRVRSYESALMMAAALIVMCGQMSFALRFYEGFSEWRGWLMDVPNSAAFRAIRIGAAVAGLILAFRMWFSIESETFSEQKK